MNETELKNKIEATLERHGFLRSVAGDRDFDAVLRATAEVIGHQKIGIYFAGGYGSGKTCAARAAAKTVAEFDGRPLPHRFNAYSKADMESLAEDAWTHGTRDVFVDDIATDMALREYGNEIDPFAAFVMAWDADIDGNVPTRLLYVTTNENAQGVEKRYGSRIFDRLAWRLAVCEFKGGTKRGSVGSPWRDPPPETDHELECMAVDALRHGTDSFVRDAEGEARVQERVRNWKQMEETRQLVRDLASRLAKRMGVSQSA